MTEVIKAEVADLQCTQEEADTRMLLQAAHTADHSAPAVVIKSPDSDVVANTLSVSHLSNRNAALHPTPRPHCHWTRTLTRSMQCPPQISCL